MPLVKRGKQTTKARSALSIQRDVIFALFLREMNRQFSGYTLGSVWILLEPLAMMLVFILLFGAKGRGEFGLVEPPVFIFVSFLPFRLVWNAVMKGNMSALSVAKGLTGFRQVRLFDLFLSRSIANAGIALMVALILGLGFTWFGFNVMPADLLEVLFYLACLWLFAFAFGMVACVVGSFLKEAEKTINIMTMPLMFLSAVFYPMTLVPPEYHDIMALNPLVHALELVRDAWFDGYVSPVADLSYLMGWTIVTLALGIAAYRLRWRRMIAS